MRKPKILIVDDDEFIRQLIGTILSKEEYELIEAHNGDSALHEVEKNEPDLIIQDLNLPDIEGLELNRLLLAHHSEIPILALTGVELKLGQSGNYRGFVGFILKPIDPDNLKRTVKRFLN
ncbi:MAG: hypothetical protein BGO43_06395 [Gammaproteobacteria bacterium 39-13]|nr:response regulator [Gammaproteobacteria bacterium]OJV90475.1 MAG: hypothetical protein BGO43_06395 [Gammaproteobacteria bacterium 39-13]